MRDTLVFKVIQQYANEYAGLVYAIKDIELIKSHFPKLNDNQIAKNLEKIEAYFDLLIRYEFFMILIDEGFDVGSDEGETVLNDFIIDEEKVSGTFEAQGYEIEMNGTFEGDLLKASISAAGYEFPFEAKKQQ